ncbi:hypothetical protein ACFLZ6_01880 [Nanoarchaeota archaeon]
MKNKKAKQTSALKLAVWILIILFCLNSALALGIRPVKTELTLQPTYEDSFKIVNNDHKDMKVKIYAQGDLKDYIELSEDEVELSASEESKEIRFSLRLPDKEFAPGKVEGVIVVEEELYSEERDGSYVAANLKISHKVYVDVPTPENFIEAKIDIEEKEEDVDLITTIKNLGTADLEEVKPKVQVFSGNKIIDSYEHETESLDVKEERSFKDKVEKEKLGKGEFKVLSSIEYAEYTLEVIEAFTIGKPIIKIQNYDKYFVENKINEIAVELKSEWNTIIEDIHLTTLVFKNGKEVFNTKTTSFNLEPYEEKKISAHIDTRDLELGEYDVNLILEYMNQTSVEKFEAYVLDVDEYRKRTQDLGPLIYILIAVITIAVAVISLLGYYVFKIKGKSKTLNRHKRKR